MKFPRAPGSLASARQLLLVVGDDWEASRGSLRAFSRASADAAWHSALAPMPVILGRSGLAWGLDDAPPGGDAVARKCEGDGRSPAGAFPITTLFGTGSAAAEAARAEKLRYVEATPNLKCVDDPESRHYNCFVDAGCGVPDWRSCEAMLRADARYEFGAVVGYNQAPVRPGAGSCIFLHVRAADGAPTAGCTALSREDMGTLFAWLDGALSPHLVQLPRAVLVALGPAWGLPDSLS